MLDDSLYARRVPALDRAEPTSHETGPRVRVLKPEARFSLRLRLGDGSPAEAAGFQLDQRINSVVTNGARWSARLGPDEWLIGGPEDDADEIARAVETALGERPHSLVAVSHRNVAIEISGPLANEALNSGCPLDLSDPAFPAGAATRTLLGKAEIVLMRAGVEPVYRVECWRSFATYAQGFLVEAVHGL